MFFSEEKNQKTFATLRVGAMGDVLSGDYRQGWQAAITAVRQWHESQAKKTLIESRRTRFPKNLERDADLHKRCAELIAILSPDDV